MPPHQCPGCGRFLTNALVSGLGDQPAPCPRCGEQLTAQLFAPAPAPTTSVRDEETRVRDEASVRPPDLPPETVRDRNEDVLAGWDVGVGPAEIASWQRDRRPFPMDTAVVLGSAAAGSLLGTVVDRNHRGRGATAGAFGGLIAAAASRRLWRLED